MIRVTLAICFGLMVVVTAGAQQKPKEDPCANATTTADMRDCAGKEYEKADADLNRAYKQLMEKLDDNEEKAALKTAQLAWLKYRDAHCEFQSFRTRGGTIHPVDYAGCLTGVTESRTKDLKDALKELTDR